MKTFFLKMDIVAFLTFCIILAKSPAIALLLFLLYVIIKKCIAGWPKGFLSEKLEFPPITNFPISKKEELR